MGQGSGFLMSRHKLFHGFIYFCLNSGMFLSRLHCLLSRKFPFLSEKKIKILFLFDNENQSSQYLNMSQLMMMIFHSVYDFVIKSYTKGFFSSVIDVHIDTKKQNTIRYCERLR